MKKERENKIIEGFKEEISNFAENTQVKIKKTTEELNTFLKNSTEEKGI